MMTRVKETRNLSCRWLERAKKTPMDCGNDIDVQPPWLDMAKFTVGRRFYLTHAFGCTAAALSGLLLVLVVPEILDTVSATGRSSHGACAFRRYLSTVVHVNAWYNGDVWKEGDAGRRSIMAVRRTHATLCRRLTERNAVAPTQYAMMLTLFGFVGLVVLHPNRFGLRPTADELAGFVHFWRAIAYLHGTDDRFNICSSATAQGTRRTCRFLLDSVFRLELNAKRRPTEYRTTVAALTDGLRAIGIPFLDDDALRTTTYDVIKHIDDTQLPLTAYSKAVILCENVRSSGNPTIMQPLQTAVGVDADCSSGHLYWADVSGKAIKRSNYDGSNIEVFIDVDVESPEGVAIDWIGRNIFWTDSIKDKIQVARLDSLNRDRKILIETDLSNPRGIAVHPTRGILFWSDWNRLNPKIETANMDGTVRTVLVTSEIELPNSLTIDSEREELCWADAGTKRIECCSLQGHNRRTIVSALLYPFGLANNRQNFYWSDWEARKIEILKKVGGQRETPIEPPLGGSGKLYGLAIVPERCPRANNPCSIQNGGCRYLCLPKGYGGRTCACPDYTHDGEELVCNEI